MFGHLGPEHQLNLSGMVSFYTKIPGHKVTGKHIVHLERLIIAGMSFIQFQHRRLLRGSFFPVKHHGRQIGAMTAGPAHSDA